MIRFAHKVIQSINPTAYIEPLIREAVDNLWPDLPLCGPTCTTFSVGFYRKSYFYLIIVIVSDTQGPGYYQTTRHYCHITNSKKIIHVNEKSNLHGLVECFKGIHWTFKIRSFWMLSSIKKTSFELYWDFWGLLGFPEKDTFFGFPIKKDKKNPTKTNPKKK